MRARLADVGVAVVLSLSSGCGRGEGPPPPARLSFQELATPAGPGSGEPGLAAGPDGRVLLSWIEPMAGQRHALRHASRTRGGAWSAPRTIAEGTDWFVNWADFPSLAALPDGTLFAHWLVKSGPGTYAYDVQTSLSRDDGKSWSPPRVPHRDGTKTEHGFVTLAPWTPERMGIVWLDGRKAGEMSLMHTTIGRDGSLGAETALDGRVCDCCQTDAARAEDATVVVYRDRTDQEIRDMSVVRFTGGRWSEPRPLAHDGWQIDGCPVNGPAIAAQGKQVAVAWFTAPHEKSAVKVAFSADAGATFGAPLTVDDGRPLGRVDVVLLDHQVALVSWLEQVGGSARVRVRRVASSGRLDEPLTVAQSNGARSSGFPRMVAAGGEVVIAWRDSAEPPRVRTAAITPAPGR